MANVLKLRDIGNRFRASAHGWLRAVAALVLLGALVPTAAAVCSTYAGNTSGPITSRIAINEYNYSGGYIEVKIIDPTLLTETSNLQNWVLTFQSSASSVTSFTVKDAVTLPSCPNDPATYLKFNVGSMGNDAVVVLWSDTARTKEVDYFRVGQKNYPSFQGTTCFPDEVPATSTTTYHQPLLQGSSSRKDIARGPDGTGRWLSTPYTGGDQGTPCASNDGTLWTTKTATASSLWIGQSVGFTVAVGVDARAGGQTSVLVNDLLPAGLSLTGTPVVSAGSYNAGTGVWTIGNVAAGSSVTLNMNATATQVGTLTNSASVQSADFPSGTVTPATAAVNVLIPTITNVADPASVSVNGQTTFTITVTNPSATLAAPAFAVSNTLDSGLTLVSATPSAGAGSFSAGIWTLPGLAAGASATLTVVAQVTQSGTWTDTAQVTMNGYAPASARATATVSTAVSAFNAWINANRTISTQVSNVAPTLTIGSFDANGSLANYNGNVAVSYQYCANVVRTSAGGISCGGTWTDVPGVAATLASFSAASTAQVTTPPLGNAYEIVRVKLLPASNVPVYGADLFAVRPPSLTVTAQDQDWLSAGTANTLNNTNPAVASPIHKAGRPFSIAVTSATGNYPGTLFSVTGLEPTVTVTAPTNGVAGTLLPGTWSAETAGFRSSSATYSEAGYFGLQLEDRHFADIDAADSTTAQRYVTGNATIGRFVPDYLTTTATPGCGTFSYDGQSFQVTVSAFAFGGASPLRNYDTAPGFSQNITLSNAGSTAGMSGNTLLKSAFTGLLGYVTTTGVKYAKPGGGAAVPATLQIRAVDTDTVSSAGASEATMAIRSGRLWMSNAYGSELLALPVPVQLQYWTASGWALNTADSCTSLALPTATSGLSNALKSNTTASMQHAPALGGLVGFVLSRPGAGNTGVVDIDTSVVRGGNTWLQLSAPSARACFGACGPRSPVIYLRERY